MGFKDIRMVSTLRWLVAWILDHIHQVRQRKERKRMMQKITAIDTEFFKHTGPLHRPGGKFACLSTTDGLAGQTKGTLYVDKPTTKKYLLGLKKSSGVIAIQNALYDIRQLRHHGLWPQGWEPRIWDTMMVEQDLFGGWYQTFNLQAIARRWLQIHLPKETVSDFIDADKLTAEMKKYALNDSKVTGKIAECQREYVANEYENEFPWYWEVDVPAMYAVMDMPPVRIDVDGWLAYAEELLAEGLQIQDELGFNVKSNPQVAAALRSAGYKLRKGTSLDQNTLMELASVSRDKSKVLLEMILRARHCRDAHSKYGTKFIEENVEDGCWIYPNWKVTGPETGRMACADPNMQNIPKKGEGLIYRSFFLATQGGILLKADVEQQEPTCSAQLSGDMVLRAEIENEVDLHQLYADFFGVDRPMGKKIHLSLNYGKTAWGLAQDLGRDVAEIEESLRARRLHYPMYHSWMDRQERQAERVHYVNSIMGGRIWTNPYSFQQPFNAKNGPVQRSAAEQTKLALGYFRELCKVKDLPFVINLVVHDEMVADIPDPKLLKVYKKIMQDAWQEAGHKIVPSLPTRIVMNTGTDWRMKSDPGDS